MKKHILCTLGPASLEATTIARLGEMGVSLFRLNLSHTRLSRLEELVSLIRAHTSVPICFDTQGAQVRTGVFEEGEVSLEAGAVVRLEPAPTLGSAGVIPLYPPGVIPQLRVGDLVSLDFNLAVLQVTAVGTRCEAQVLCAGMVGSNKAVSMDRALLLPPLTDDDRAALEIANRLDIRHIALSFANRGADVAGLRRLAGRDLTIIAKVESRSGFEHLDEILDEADAILIDRGDLSREIPIESVPFVQKEVLSRARRASVPAYVATNLLESMVASRHPTRAEVNDVVNTLMDGATGLVLAAETAIGQHPISCVGMIRALIERYEAMERGAPPAAVAAASGLIAPHGGRLVHQFMEAPADSRSTLPVLEVDDRAAMDVWQLATGGFSPVEGFMTRDELSSVVDHSRLPDGRVWPLPVFLQLPAGVSASAVPTGQVLVAFGGRPYAIMEVAETFRWNLRNFARRWLGTDRDTHPGVAQLLAGSDLFVAGRTFLLTASPHPRPSHVLAPAQARVVFAQRQWRKVVGFHTRNVPHRAHEHLQLTALQRAGCDGLFVHPVVGRKKGGDYTGDCVMRTYGWLIANHYPPNRALASGFWTYSRYAGPREALFTALCRQNFGCTHFIVGRDHTGVGDFYAPDASRRYIEAFAADIEIEPLFCDEVYYCHECAGHVSECAHGDAHAGRISGTEARRMLQRGELPPDWFMREPVSRMVVEDMQRGAPVFVE